MARSTGDAIVGVGCRSISFNAISTHVISSVSITTCKVVDIREVWGHKFIPVVFGFLLSLTTVSVEYAVSNNLFAVIVVELKIYEEIQCVEWSVTENR